MQRKTWNRIIPAVAGLAATIVAALPASAHEGHHEQMPLMQALRHLVSEPDHQIAFAALVVLAVIAGWSWRRAKARK
jgi:hydrogenase/urease accessory protein HupE